MSLRSSLLRPSHLLLVLGSCLAAGPAGAAWPSDPLNPLLVCPSTGAGIGGDVVVSDGAGGFVVAWEEQRTVTIDAYAQHVLADGTIDPAWPPLGVALSTDPAHHQQALSIASDGAGGAFVAWMDIASDWDIHVQHVLAGGAVDPRWPTDGQVVCALPGLQAYPVVASDEAGGVLIAWFDGRVSGSWRVFTLRLHADGSVAPGWIADGNPLSTIPDASQIDPAILSDGSGGAIVAWEESRPDFDGIVAQHVQSDGTADPAWPLAGLALSPRAVLQETPRIAHDGAGGAIVTWRDVRESGAGIGAQHVLASGALDPAWPDTGRVLCPHAEAARSWPAVAADGAGGAFVCWMDDRNDVSPSPLAAPRRSALTAGMAWGASGLTASRGRFALSTVRNSTMAAPNWDIYAQHVTAAGLLDASWPAEGLQLCGAPGIQWFPEIVGGVGSATVVWQDFRQDTVASLVSDVYLQRVLAHVGVDPGWPVDGLAPCTRPGNRYAPALVADGAGGVACLFGDARTDAPGLYAQRILPSGMLGEELPVPVLAALLRATFTSGGVRLSWGAPEAHGAAGTLERRGEDTDWEPLVFVHFDGEGNATCDDITAAAGNRYAYRLAIVTGGVTEYSQESWVTIPAAVRDAALRAPSPVTGGSLDVTFTPPDARPVALELFDVSGRRVASVLSSGSAGRRTASLVPASALEPGIYLVRVGLERPALARVAVIR